MDAAALSSDLPLYAQIGQRMAGLIDGRVFKAGQKLPSVRDIAAHNGVSIATAVQAFRWLEERHLVTARPRSGYFVTPRSRGPALPAMSRPPRHSVVVDRASRAEARYLAQYNAMDAAVSRMNSLNAYVAQQVTLWNKSSG